MVHPRTRDGWLGCHERSRVCLSPVAWEEGGGVRAPAGRPRAALRWIDRDVTRRRLVELELDLETVCAPYTKRYCTLVRSKARTKVPR